MPETKEEAIKRVKELTKKYPFLRIRDAWTGKLKYDCTYTELDFMPDGWREAFGLQMCEEIAQVLKKADYLYKYRIVDIKEKYGSLRWYDAGAPDEIYDELEKVIEKYERISSRTCIRCGRPATLISRGWICPYCEGCAQLDHCESFDPIEQEEENAL